MHIVERKCLECGHTFEVPSTSNKRICGIECERARRIRRKREKRRAARPIWPTICLCCGDIIESPHGMQRYCIKEYCQTIRKRVNMAASKSRQMAVDANPEAVPCVICGRNFISKCGRTTCGRTDCIEENKRIKARERRARMATDRVRAVSVEQTRRAAETPVEEIERRVASAQCPFAGEWKDDKGRIWPQMSTNIPGVSWDDPIMDPMSGGFPMITFNAPVAQEVAA